MLTLKTRALILLPIILLELYSSSSLNGLWSIIERSSIVFKLFTFEDLFLRTPVLSLIFILIYYGKNATALISHKEVSPYYFSLFLCLHILSVFIFFFLANSLNHYKELFINYFLILGFFSLCSAKLFLWMAFLKLSKKELLLLILKIWKPILVAILAMLAYKLFLYSYENNKGALTMIALPLKTTVFEGIYLLLNIYSNEVIYNFNKLELGTTSFSIILKAGCSGIQGINLFILSSLMFYSLEKTNLTITKKKYLTFIAIGVIASVLLNILRISLLIMIGDLGYSEWALGSFHSHIGISISLVLIVIFCGSINHFYSKNQLFSTFSSFIYSNPVNPYILPFIILLSLSIFFKALTPSWDIWYPLKVIGMTFSLYIFKDYYKKLITINFNIVPLLLGILIALIWFLIPLPNDKSDLKSTSFTFTIIWVIFKIIGSCFLIPIIEELAFRGFFLRFLIKVDFKNVQLGTFSLFSFILTSFIFGLLHQHFLAGIVSGALLNISLYYRKSIFDAIFSHMIANIIIALVVIIFGRWEYWL